MTASPEDFRGLFRQESAQRLARLQQQFLAMESEGPTEALVASVFRDAHSLKGAAALLELHDIAPIAQVMEDILDEVRNHVRPVTPALVDLMLETVDALGPLIRSALSGGSPTADARQVESRLRGEADAGAPPAPGTPARLPEPSRSGGERADARGSRRSREPARRLVPVAAVTAVDAAPPDAAVPQAAPPSAAGRAEPRLLLPDTVSVPAERLDRLVGLVGEVAAAHLRLAALVDAQVTADPNVREAMRDVERSLRELQELTLRARMVPFGSVTDSLHRAAREAARTLGKHIRWEVAGQDTELDRLVLQKISDPLVHLVRNAVGHGLEPGADRVAAGKPEIGSVRVRAVQRGSEVVVSVADDGRGIDVDAVRTRAAERGLGPPGSEEDVLDLLFLPGMSTAGEVTPLSGRGVGLDVARSGVAAVRGRVEVESVQGEGCEFRLIVPITLAILSCLVVEVAGERYAVPVHSVLSLERLSPDRTEQVEGRHVVRLADGVAELFELATLLSAAPGCSERRKAPGYAVVVSGTGRRSGLVVDQLLGQRDIVVKNFGELLPRSDIVAGASVEPDGTIMLVLDAQGLIDHAQRADRVPPPAAVMEAGASPPLDARRSVLVVDDTLTVRELERSILERAGYRVSVAGNGREALALLSDGPVDLVVTDVEMPEMDGFALTEAIRADATLTNLPVLILTSRGSDEDRRRGLDAGADAYVVKSAFDETALLAAITRLLGEQR
jgi:two-component system chemotaxis sensor kinase CheA